MKSNWYFGFLLLLTGLVVGCSGRSAEVVEVEGTVTMNGQPLPEVMITFMPDPEEGAFGRPSSAVTDANGKYRLKYSGDSAEYGAEVGNHRITVSDFKAENARENPISPRIHQKYVQPATTDLRYKVESGEKQTHDFSVDPR